MLLFFFLCPCTFKLIHEVIIIIIHLLYPLHPKRQKQTAQICVKELLRKVTRWRWCHLNRQRRSLWSADPWECLNVTQCCSRNEPPPPISLSYQHYFNFMVKCQRKRGWTTYRARWGTPPGSLDQNGPHLLSYLILTLRVLNQTKSGAKSETLFIRVRGSWGQQGPSSHFLPSGHHGRSSKRAVKCYLLY